MYGLKQAAILAYRHLVNCLAPHGYEPVPFTTGIWRHKTRRTKFCLCVDDFGVKYFNDDEKNHFLSSLRQHYKISVDEGGTNYCGFTIKWNYEKEYVDISMPGYIEKVLHKYQHKPPSRPQHAPHKWTQPVYGQKQQLTPDPDQSDLLDKADTKLIQGIVGSLLYYSRAIDPCLLPGIQETATMQAKPTQKNKRCSYYVT